MNTTFLKNINIGLDNFKLFGLFMLAVVILTSCETSTLSELAEDSIAEIDDDAPEEQGEGEGQQEQEESNLVTYENRARLILDNACVECHNSVNATAGIRLDNFSFARDVAESGRMIARMTSQSNPMPPSGNLPDSIIEDIMQWIDDGLLEN